MDTSQPSTSTSGQAPPPPKGSPITLLVIGMAGTGKTTFIQRINSHLHAKSIPGYVINLDPAATHLPYGANIDIRDTVNYKNVMKQYNLGPNGGILTSCNLFATRFDQVITLCEKPRDPPLKYIVVDTPGQIEIFTWSASGTIITEVFASTFPTVVVYIVDTPRCTNPQTFMSNMLQACSILYKTKLPLLLVFNKVDVTRHQYALDWMADFEKFGVALEADQSYAATLSRSLSLVLDEFYQNIPCVGVSAMTGEGVDTFFEAVHKCAEEYNSFYRPEIDKMRAEKERKMAKQEELRVKKELNKLAADLSATKISAASQTAPVVDDEAGSDEAASMNLSDDEPEDYDGFGEDNQAKPPLYQ